jgi:hypothetical protein
MSTLASKFYFKITCFTCIKITRVTCNFLVHIKIYEISHGIFFAYNIGFNAI